MALESQTLFSELRELALKRGQGLISQEQYDQEKQCIIDNARSGVGLSQPRKNAGISPTNAAYATSILQYLVKHATAIVLATRHHKQLLVTVNALTL